MEQQTKETRSLLTEGILKSQKHNKCLRFHSFIDIVLVSITSMHITRSPETMCLLCSIHIRGRNRNNRGTENLVQRIMECSEYFTSMLNDWKTQATNMETALKDLDVMIHVLRRVTVLENEHSSLNHTLNILWNELFCFFENSKIIHSELEDSDLISRTITLLQAHFDIFARFTIYQFLDIDLGLKRSRLIL